MKNIDIIKDAIRKALVKAGEVIDSSTDLFDTLITFRQTLSDLTFELVSEQVSKDEFDKIFNDLYDGGWIDEELDCQYEES